jgi:hypothetical protein
MGVFLGLSTTISNRLAMAGVTHFIRGDKGRARRLAYLISFSMPTMGTAFYWLGALALSYQIGESYVTRQAIETAGLGYGIAINTAFFFRLRAVTSEVTDGRAVAARWRAWERRINALVMNGAIVATAHFALQRDNVAEVAVIAVFGVVAIVSQMVAARLPMTSPPCSPKSTS